MITTKGVYHLGIPVNDVERAVKFYTDDRARSLIVGTVKPDGIELEVHANPI